MAYRKPGQSADRAVAFLATCVVMLGGGATCVFVILTSTKDPLLPLLICGAVLMTSMFPIWLLRDKPVRQKTMNAAWYWFRRSIANDRTADYEPRRRRRRRAKERHAPPTIETVRDLAEGGNTWVPSGNSRHEGQPK